MLQLKNNTPFAAAFALFPNEQGVDTLYTMVKATFDIGPQWTLHKNQFPPQQVDLYWGEPGKSSLRMASDHHTGKASTDIIMIGSACTLEKQLTRQLDVKLAVGSVSKTVRVFGNRYWRQGLITTPETFSSMPLIYERAYGGEEVLKGQVVSADSRNPVGCGYAGKKSVLEVEGLPLPNLECPRHLIQSLNDKPTPSCFAPIAGHWQPRIGFAGTYDDLWKQDRAPYLPTDYNSKFMNVAHPDLIYPTFLTGGEAVSIQGMHPIGELKFNLPLVALSHRVIVEGNVYTSPFVMETLILDPNQLRLSMVWRAALACDKRMVKVKQILVGLTR